MPTATQALALPKDLHPLRSIAEFNDFLDTYKDAAIILAPITVLDYLPEVAMLSLRRLFVDAFVPAPNKSGPECYHNKLFCNGDPKDPNADVALGKVALLRILGAAGLSMAGSDRTDNRRVLNFAEWKVTVAGRDFDGQWRQTIGTRPIDLRDGSNEIRGWTPQQLAGARAHIGRTAETKALEAAIREWLAVQQTYKVGVLKTKPFIIPKLIPNPDHPAVTRVFIEGFLNPTVASLYPARLGPAAGEDVKEAKQIAGRRDEPVTHAGLTGVADAHAAAAEHAEKVAGNGDDEDGDTDVGDYDVPILGAEPAKEIRVCQCPCGDQVEIGVDAEESTVKILGVARCINCFPGLKLLSDEARALAWYNAHRNLKDLGFTKAPWAGLTADKLLERFKAGKGKA